MQKENSYSGKLGEWQRLLASVDANEDSLPQLEGYRARLGEVVTALQDLVRRQAALASEKQDLSVQIRGVVKDAQRLATLVRRGLVQHYGTRSERLTRFGLQPYRGRKSAASKIPPTLPAEAPKPADSFPAE